MAIQMDEVVMAMDKLVMLCMLDACSCCQVFTFVSCSEAAASCQAYWSVLVTLLTLLI